MKKYVIKFDSGRYFAGEAWDKGRKDETFGYCDTLEEAYKTSKEECERHLKLWPHIFCGSKIEEVEK